MARKEQDVSNSKALGAGSARVRARLLAALAEARPKSRDALWQFVRGAYGMAVPRRAVCPGHAAPMDYLAQAILSPGRDIVVWASRGGAKTELGSMATHLDSILRPGCQTRILGGSLDQSEKMYEYLARKWDGVFSSLLAREPTARRTELVNGSSIEVLTQSARSVRGQRVHRLKCDEVDEFSPEVWQAAQFVTQSSPGTGPAARGRGRIPAQMEVFSTLHKPFGTMAQLVDRLTDCGLRNADCGLNNSMRPERAGPAVSNPQSEIRNPQSNGHKALAAAAARVPQGPLLLKWCLWEVIEPCPADRSCSRCPLWPDCEGRARGADGYFPIDDAIAQRARASRQAWEAEMLCRRPRADGLVFADFDPARHVAAAAYDPNLPLYRAIDFGYANPFVCLWVQVKGDCGMRIADCGLNDPRRRQSAVCRDPKGSASFGGGGEADLSAVQLRVVGEYVARERPISEHAREMAARDPGPVLATFANPAGRQRTDVTGTGPCQELAAMGIRVRTPYAGILEGVELLRRLTKERPAWAGPGLVVDPRCRWLVRAFQEYHWEESANGLRNETPAKDGADHPIDALRYLVTGLFLNRGLVRRRMW